MSNKEYYIFNEPHPTGGDSTVRISREQLLEHESLYRSVWIETEEPTEQMIVDNFCTIHGAWKESNDESFKRNEQYEKALSKAVHLIDGLTEATECFLDHNGKCQEHGFARRRCCTNSEALEFLGTYEYLLKENESAKEMAERLGMELPNKETQMATLNRNLREIKK